jgi:hypothetical protein
VNSCLILSETAQVQVIQLFPRRFPSRRFYRSVCTAKPVLAVWAARTSNGKAAASAAAPIDCVNLRRLALVDMLTTPDRAASKEWRS